MELTVYIPRPMASAAQYGGFTGNAHQNGGARSGSFYPPEWAAFDRDHAGQLGSLSGTRYTQSQIEGLLAQAGWPQNLIPTMSAIIMGESGGYAAAANTSGEYSIGLAQINIDPKLHRPWTRAQLEEPLFNLRTAYTIYQQQGFRAWGAYTNGSYKKYLGKGGSSSTAPSGGTAGDSGSVGIGGITAAGALIGLAIIGLVLRATGD